MRRGLPNSRRVHAKNFIQQQADARLQESVRPYQQQGLNSLGVDSHEILLYLKQHSTRVCTCKEVQTEIPEMGVVLDTAAPVFNSGTGSEHEVSIDWSTPLFGEPNEATFEEEHLDDADSYALDDAPAPHMNQLIEQSPECGICYRNGFVPGLVQFGQTRFVLTTHDLLDQNSYTIDRQTAPHTFNRLHVNGWVEFELPIPKYFKRVTYSIRNNLQILSDKPFNGVVPLTLDDLKQNAGRSMFIRVNSQEFTHVVFTFDLGSDPVRANIAQLSKVTDWTQFEALGNVNVVLPTTIRELSTGSCILVPKHNLAMRVTDVQYLRTAGGANIDWSCTARISQPQEGFRNIAKGFLLL